MKATSVSNFLSHKIRYSYVDPNWINVQLEDENGLNKKLNPIPISIIFLGQGWARGCGL